MLPEPPTARVLLVDDKPQNLLALEAALSNLHLDVVKAASGEEALAERYVLSTSKSPMALCGPAMPALHNLWYYEFRRPRLRAVAVVEVEQESW